MARIENQEQLIEEMNNPDLAQGFYLAYLQEVTDHVGKNSGLPSFKCKWVINRDTFADKMYDIDDWTPTDNVYNLTNWVNIKFRNRSGEVEVSKFDNGILSFSQALGIEADDEAANVQVNQGRIVAVRIGWEKNENFNNGDPVAVIKKYFQFKNPEGEIAPYVTGSPLVVETVDHNNTF